MGNSLCGAGRDATKRICDPADLVSPSAAKAVSIELAELAGEPAAHKSLVGTCPQDGYLVYVAVLRALDASYTAAFPSADEALSAFASDLGRRSQLLGSKGPCTNVMVLAYSAEDGLIGLAGGSGVPPGIKVRGLSADDSVDDAIEDAAHQVAAKLNPSPDGRPSAATLAFYPLGSGVDRVRIALSLVGGVLGTAWVLLSICCVYDTVAHWRHRARYSSCLEKIKRVHTTLVQGSGELSLCPICVDSMPKCEVVQAYNQRLIVFLCGHRFHADCSNGWFDRHPQKMGRCPICDLPHSLSVPEIDPPYTEAQIGDNEACRAMNSIDEVKAFFLASLQAQYPDIIKDGDVKRWRTCHTEIWLSELTCPWYHSIFSSPKKAK